MGTTLSCRRSSSIDAASLPSYYQHYHNGQESYSENAADFLEEMMDNNPDYSSSGLHSFMADLAMAELNSSQRARFEQRREARRAEREAARTRFRIVMPEEDPVDDDSNGPPPAPVDVIRQLPKVKASELDAGTITSKPCGVCCEKYNDSDTVTKLPCGHAYHSLCVEEWLHRRGTCPMCRFKLGTKEEVGNTQEKRKHVQT